MLRSRHGGLVVGAFEVRTHTLSGVKESSSQRGGPKPPPIKLGCDIFVFLRKHAEATCRGQCWRLQGTYIPFSALATAVMGEEREGNIWGVRAAVKKRVMPEVG